MGGGGGGHGSSSAYRGYVHHAPKRWHVVTGKGLCAVMWFWVLYRAKQDGPVVLGWRHPWDGHEDHSHGHGHEHEMLQPRASLHVRVIVFSRERVRELVGVATPSNLAGSNYSENLSLQ